MHNFYAHMRTHKAFTKIGLNYFDLDLTLFSYFIMQDNDSVFKWNKNHDLDQLSPVFISDERLGHIVDDELDKEVEFITSLQNEAAESDVHGEFEIKPEKRAKTQPSPRTRSTLSLTFGDQRKSPVQMVEMKERSGSYSDNEKHLLDKMFKLQKQHETVVHSYEDRINELMEKMHDLKGIAELLEQSGGKGTMSAWASQETLDRHRGK